ncbi:MAG: hypothetical protein ACRCUY_14060 [Thermoguttaceae bacterium]
MFRFISYLIVGLIIPLFCCTFFCVQIDAAERVRIDNEIRAGESTAIKSTAYLIGNNFYSFIGDAGEVTFFDAEKEVFTLIHPALRLKTFLDGAETRQKAESLREAAHEREKQSAYWNFLVKPVFQQERNDVTGTIALQSFWIDYLLTTSGFPDDNTAARFFRFCDWTCYLNLRLSPQSSTMFARLEVNRILRESNRFPHKITMSIYPKGKTGIRPLEEQMSSTHQMVFRFTELDDKRLDQVHEWMRVFQTISFAEYQEKMFSIVEKK